MLLLLLALGAHAATRVALPTGTNMDGWEDAAASAGVELAVNASADVLVIATPDAWYLRVVALDLEAEVDPPRTSAEREALLTLAASLARPVGAARARTVPAPVDVTGPPAPSPVATASTPRPTPPVVAPTVAPRPTPTVAPRSTAPDTAPSVAPAAPRPTTPPVAPPGESPPVAPRSTPPVEPPAIAPAPAAPAPAVAPAGPIAAAPLGPSDAAPAAPLLPAVVPLPTFPVEPPVVAPAPAIAPPPTIAAAPLPPAVATSAAPARPTAIATPTAPPPTAVEAPPLSPTETQTVTPAPTQPRFYPALSVGVAARTDGALAAQVGASVGWAARPWLRVSVGGGYTSSAPLPSVIADGRMSAAELGASLEVGERWFARAGGAATLAWFTQDGADRGTAAWPSLHIAGGYALPTGPIVVAPEIGLHGDLAEASLLVGETAAATLPPLRVELRLSVRTR